jgi:hypothetical protein
MYINVYIEFLLKIVMEEDYKLKMAVISGASHAIRYKEKNPKADEQEIIQHVTNQSEEIIKKIDEEGL